jgi:integrase
MDAGTITIERQLVNVVGKVQEDSPKSSASGRVVAIGKEGVGVLKAHGARTNADRLAWGPAYSHTSRVFVREDGTDLDPSWLLKEFQRQAFKADLPPVRLHDLSHAAASLMLASGSSMKVVSTVLGHSSTAITSDVYTSVYDDASAAAVDAMRCARSSLAIRRARGD